MVAQMNGNLFVLKGHGISLNDIVSVGIKKTFLLWFLGGWGLLGVIGVLVEIFTGNITAAFGQGFFTFILLKLAYHYGIALVVTTRNFQSHSCRMTFEEATMWRKKIATAIASRNEASAVR